MSSLERESARILITGGCGFIGKNFIRYIRRVRPGWELVNLDALTYAGDPRGLPSEAPGTYRFVRGDIRDPAVVDTCVRGCDAVVNFAAESHVDRSILEPRVFIETNILGTLNLLDAAKRDGIHCFVQVSTDEVYGSLAKEDDPSTEDHIVAPRSPYAATKAGADHVAMSFYATYGLDIRVTRCCNNYGPYQFPEKLIPLVITSAIMDQEIPVYGDGTQRRDWIHVEDHCSAILAVLEHGRGGEIYNIGAHCEVENLTVIERILELLPTSSARVKFVKDRLGHDTRYAIDSYKLRSEIGWSPEHQFEAGLESVVRWYVDNREWWGTLLDQPEYRKYYVRQYGEGSGD